MAKIEKIGNIQIVDNKEDKFFYFPMISMACTGSVFFICCFFTSPFAGWRRTLRKSDWSKVNIGERRAGNPIVSPSCVLSACMTGCGNDTVIIRLERQEDKSSRERMDM